MAGITYTLTKDFRAKGGMATLASVQLDDGRQAVLRKFQAVRLLNVGLRRKFINGMRIREALSGHPNIVGSYDSSAGLVPYELIEFVPGANLNAVIGRNDDFYKKNKLVLLRQAAEGLAHLHKRKYIHLDVKPENFLIRSGLDVPAVKLTDFDLSISALDGQPPKQKGTPEYMAPEQFNEKVCYQTSDVFAFGILAYRIMTNRMPFSGSSAHAALRQQASMTVAARAPHELTPTIPPKLEIAIIHALEKNWRKRTPDLCAFLEDWGIDNAVTARPQSKPPQSLF